MSMNLGGQAPSRPRKFTIVDADDARGLLREIETAVDQGYAVIVSAGPTSNLAPVLKAMEKGLVIGIVGRPLRHAEIRSVIERDLSTAAVFRDLTALIRQRLEPSEHAEARAEVSSFLGRVGRVFDLGWS